MKVPPRWCNSDCRNKGRLSSKETNTCKYPDQRLLWLWALLIPKPYSVKSSDKGYFTGILSAVCHLWSGDIKRHLWQVSVQIITSIALPTNSVHMLFFYRLYYISIYRPFSYACVFFLTPAAVFFTMWLRISVYHTFDGISIRNTVITHEIIKTDLTTFQARNKLMWKI